MQAAALGIDPLQTPDALFGEDDPDLEHHRRLNFADYGVDDYGNRATNQPLDSDAYVEVEPVLDRLQATDVGTWMNSLELKEEMDAVAGPPWPIPQDFGVQRYIRVLEALDARLRETFPQMRGIQRDTASPNEA